MPIGTIAWALIITVTNPVPCSIPYANPPAHFTTQAECENVAFVITSKVHQAGLQAQLSARCERIEYIDIHALPKS